MIAEALLGPVHWKMKRRRSKARIESRHEDLRIGNNDPRLGRLLDDECRVTAYVKMQSLTNIKHGDRGRIVGRSEHGASNFETERAVSSCKRNIHTSIISMTDEGFATLEVYREDAFR